MEIRMQFLGAAQNVTGSCYMVEVNGSRILVDCGMFQEWKLKTRNWEKFPVPAAPVDITKRRISTSWLLKVSSSQMPTPMPPTVPRPGLV